MSYQEFQGVLVIVEGIGLLLFAGAMLWTRWRTGANGVAADIIQTYKTRVEQLEQSEKEAKSRMHEHTIEIGKLQGVLQEKEKEADRMRAILENRNPELITTLKAIKLFMEKIDGHMQEHTEILKAPQLVRRPKKGKRPVDQVLG